MYKNLILSAILAGFLVACGDNNINQKITTSELLNNLNSPNYIIIDTREDSLYNGFKDGDAKRGGHIATAIQFSSSWLGKIDDDKFISFAAGKGITKDKTLIIYDTDLNALAEVAAEFRSHGFKVLEYENFKEYAENEKLSMQSYPNFYLSVSPKWARAAQLGQEPEGFNGKELKIFEVSWGSIEKSNSYLSHIVGAYHFDTDLIEVGPIWNLRSVDEIRKNLAANGIDSNSHILLYSDNQLAALRVLFALKYAGVSDVRFLNGGITAWRDLGYPIETKINIPIHIDNFGNTKANLNINISMPDDVFTMQKSNNLKLVSNRSWDEYIGKTSGYDYIKGKGEPAGAIWGFAGTNSSNVADYYDPDGTLRNPDEIFKLWSEQGINKDDYLAFYCGTGWRASVSWFMTQLAGWKHSYVYDGGWNAWQMDSRYPIQTGAPNSISKPDAKNDYGKVYKAGGSCKS